MVEEWREIPEFPGYYVSDLGQVIGVRSKKSLTRSYIQNGIPTVGLIRDSKQYRRSVPLLVANSWLDDPPREDFITPIHLDADRSNCRMTNLMWRPRWFAINYHKEYVWNPFKGWRCRIQAIETQEIFEGIQHAAQTYGVLQGDIYKNIYETCSVFPIRLNFRLFK